MGLCGICECVVCCVDAAFLVPSLYRISWCTETLEATHTLQARTIYVIPSRQAQQTVVSGSCGCLRSAVSWWIMVDAPRALYMVVVLVVVGWYSFLFMRNLNHHLSHHFISTIDAEMETNPYMRRDLEEYRARLKEQEQQQEQVADLELQAKRIQEQLSKLSKALPLNPGSATVPGFTNVTDEEAHDSPNHSRTAHLEL